MVTIGQNMETVAATLVERRNPKSYDIAPDAVARQLERSGFLRTIAGDADFERAVKAIVLSCREHRGILFAGTNGSGKTRLMEAIFDSTPTCEKSWVECPDALQVSWLTQSDIYDRNVYLDDLGGEVMAYGDNDIIGAFIAGFYAHNSNRLLFATTNLTSAQIDERYGGRILDRLFGMCIICKLEGKSKREIMKV